jgi:5'-nucleotidase/UDP-sugar diphosphatase
MKTLRYPGALLLTAGALLGAACVEFNPECAAPVSNPDAVTGWLSGNVDITKAAARTGDNAVGQLAAEAYFHALDAPGAAELPDAAVINAGSIRSEGLCGQANTVLKKGPVKRGKLREILFFDNRVLVGTITHHQLKNVLEHSVAKLSPSGTGSPAGSFLQIAGMTYAADCAKSAEVLNSDGSRKAEGQRVTRITLIGRDGTPRDLALNPPSDSETIRLAAPEFMFQLQGNDDFYDLRGLNVAPTTFSVGGFDFEIIASYFAKHYPESAPLASTPAARTSLVNCP